MSETEAPLGPAQREDALHAIAELQVLLEPITTPSPASPAEHAAGVVDRLAAVYAAARHAGHSRAASVHLLEQLLARTTSPAARPGR